MGLGEGDIFDKGLLFITLVEGREGGKRGRLMSLGLGIFGTFTTTHNSVLYQ